LSSSDLLLLLFIILTSLFAPYFGCAASSSAEK